MLPREASSALVLLSALLLIQYSHQYSSGAPEGACIDQLPRHSTILPQSSPPPYVLVTSSPQVRQGDVINVTIGSPGGAPMPIGGFILQAREIQNPNKTIGRFVAAAEKTKLVQCESANDTATHTSPEDKSAVTLQWEAPEHFLGSVAFRATVAQGYATFWRGVQSPLVEIVTPNTTIATTTTAAPTTDTQPPPIIMESKPKPVPVSLDVIYQGCADTKLCFGIPSGCLETGNCKSVVAIFVAGDVFTFEMQATGNPKYVASGLSFDGKMGDDSAMECVNNNGRVNLYTSWTYPKAEPYVSRSDSPQDIVRLLQSSVADGKLYCKFTRDPISTVKGNTFDLAGGKYYLMVLSGDSMKDADRVGFHSLSYEATAAALAASAPGAAAAGGGLLRRLHGALMVAAWLAAAGAGTMLPRYFKQTWVGKQFGGKDIWFAWHRVLMVLTWLLTVAGFVLIVVEVGGWSTTGDNPHAITGLVTVILCFLQPIGAYFRPHPGTSKRVIFNWTHWFLGNSAHILGIATIFLAVYLQKAELPIWSIYILAAFVAFHVIMHIILSLTMCISDGRISNGRVNSFPMKDMRGQRHATPVDSSGDAPFSGFRKLLLGIYIPVVILFSVAMICLVALAPIAQTYNNIMGS